MAPLILFTAATVLLGSIALSSALPTNMTALSGVSGLEGPFVSDISQCPKLTRRTSVPTSVKDLRPDDFKVIMALGDSITAAFAARGHQITKPFALLDENRGLSFAMGGDRQTKSLNNFFKAYSPSLQGESTGNHLVEVCYGLLCPPFQYKPSDGFNAAQSGAMVQNLDGEVDYLIRTVKNDRDVDVKQDWKLLNVLIGANDMCQVCDSGIPAAETYERQMRAVIEKIRKNFPRTVVSIQTIFKVSGVWDLTKDIPYCKTIRAFGLKYECSCAFSDGDKPKGIAERKKMDAAADSWNDKLFKIAADYRGKYDDFAVIIDPATGNTPVNKFAPDFISNIDCFHPSDDAHEFLAKSIWNNLFLPSDKKAQTYSLSGKTEIYCPTENDRIHVL